MTRRRLLRLPRTQQTAEPESRSAIVDSVRGLAILFVVLSHSWKVWPAERRGWLGPFEFLFSSGSTAVSVFFVISGFLVARSFMRTEQTYGLIGPLVWFIRRTLRILIQVWFLLACIYVMSRLDPADPWSDTVTARSLSSAATLTWNQYVRDNALEARSDIGALYFVCIDVQFFAAALIIFLLLRHRPNLLISVTTLALASSTVWRYVVYQEQGWFVAVLSTLTRMDALLWGVLAALLLRRVRSTSVLSATGLVGATLLVLSGAFIANAFVGIGAYFGLLGVVVGAVTAVLVSADAMDRQRDSFADRALSQPRLQRMGRASLSIFLWHIPIFEWVAVHTQSWDPLPRSLMALLLLAVVVTVVERLIAQPLTRAARHWGQTTPKVEDGSAR